MASTLLLVIIYLSFVSLGLPDSMLGAAWPMIYPSIGADISQAGLISMTVCAGTIVSSLSFGRLRRRFSTRSITAASIAITSLSLFLFGKMTSLYAVLPVALVLGLGAGAVDSALNNYVALHYSTGAMSFLHGFWGVGTTIGPIILGIIIPLGYTWRTGYSIISQIQLSILVIFLIGFPLWKINETKKEESEEEKSIGFREALGRKGAIYALLGFFAYCSMENTIMVWNGTYMVSRGMEKALAASFSSLFFWGMTTGRILTGFIADRLGDTRVIRIGIIILIVAIPLTLLIPTSALPVALFLLGLGAGPFYPMMIHQTPRLYGSDASASLIGLQMASAYVGSTLMPPLFGLISKFTGLWTFPLYLTSFFLLLLFATEKKRMLLLKRNLLK